MASRSSSWWPSAAVVLPILWLGLVGSARAQPEAAPGAAEPERTAAGSEGAERQADRAGAADPQLERARARYREGVQLVNEARWNEALAAFEESARLRPHAWTTFNRALCERALGRYTRARETFELALSEHERRGGELAASLAEEARGYVAELGRVLVLLDVRLDTPGATLAVDGRPLELRRGPQGETLLVAGLAPPGPGRALPARRVRLLLDPGARVLTLSRKGFADAVVRRTWQPGARDQLDLSLERLPASLRVSSSVDGALVTVGGRDVGPVPVTVLRPAGSYRVVVSKDGYEPYEAEVRVQAGEETELSAKLLQEETQLTERWWFWAGAAAIVAGGVAVTYAVTRPEPTPPPYDGGTTGWVVYPSGGGR